MSLAAEDTVVVKNIWYMLAYAYRALDVVDYARIKSEDFENLDDLLSAILAAGLDAQRMRGFERDYIEIEEDIPGVRGKIDLEGTLQHKLQRRALTRCAYDDYRADTLKNRILKTTAMAMLRSDEVRHETKASLKKNLMLMRDVKMIDPSGIEWRRLNYHRNNRSYELLMGACYLTLNRQLPAQEKGEIRFASFLDNQKLHALYEKFVLEYFRRHHPHLRASAKEIPRGVSENAPSFLPKLQTDITLASDEQTLIIDTKCYGKILRGNAFGNEILSPGHLNQILSYVMHEQYESPKRVSGMLLYALTDRDEVRHEHWREIGIDLYCHTLDLGRDFKEIASQLDEIAGLVG